MLVLLALAALAAPVGVAATFADSPGARSAYALVDPNNGSPRLVAAHTQGFAAVNEGPFGSGDYCLTPAAGVDVTDTAAVASEEAFYSNAAGFVTVRYPTSGPDLRLESAGGEDVRSVRSALEPDRLHGERSVGGDHEEFAS